jgi:hypothetical protein
MIGLEDKFEEFQEVMINIDGKGSSLYAVYEPSFKGTVVVFNGKRSISLPFDQYTVNEDGVIVPLKEAKNG